jgi:DNA-binding NarL/FixJ family response regulator
MHPRNPWLPRVEGKHFESALSTYFGALAWTINPQNEKTTGRIALSPITLFACEQQPIVSEGLARVCEAVDDIEYLGSAMDLVQALAAVREQHPNVLFVDQAIGLKSIFQFLAEVRATWAGCQPVLWVTDLAEVDCFRALQQGARGVLRKSHPVSTILECIRSVNANNLWIESSAPEERSPSDRRTAPRLTPREREIVHHVCGGLKNREIAAALSITPGTVKVHLMHIFEKSGVKDRFELAVQGRKLLGAEHSRDLRIVEAVLSE